MVTATSRTTLREALAAKPRVTLAHLPTPLDEAPRLSERLGVRVLIKRDDQTGLAFGGNKARKLEYIYADVLASGADTVITTGASQSNHARMTAAAAAKLGLAAHLVLNRGLHPEMQGNLLLDRLLGAEVHLIDDGGDPNAMTRAMDDLAEELRAAGRKPYIIPLGGSTPTGALGYAAMIDELLSQLEERGVEATHLYAVSGSCGMHAGILAGLIACESPMIVQGICVSHSDRRQNLALGLTVETLRLLGLDDEVDPSRIRTDDRFVGPNYGVPTPEMIEALQILARDEGVIFDPVYTGKAMAGLIGHAREGLLTKDDTAVFLHSGGLPGLFAYHQEISDALVSTNGL